MELGIRVGRSRIDTLAGAPRVDHRAAPRLPRAAPRRDRDALSGRRAGALPVQPAHRLRHDRRRASRSRRVVRRRAALGTGACRSSRGRRSSSTSSRGRPSSTCRAASSSGATSFYALTCLVGAVLVGLRGALGAAALGIGVYALLCAALPLRLGAPAARPDRRRATRVDARAAHLPAARSTRSASRSSRCSRATWPSACA